MEHMPLPIIKYIVDGQLITECITYLLETRCTLLYVKDSVFFGISLMLCGNKQQQRLPMSFVCSRGLVVRVVDLRPRVRGFEASQNLRVGLASVRK